MKGSSLLLVALITFLQLSVGENTFCKCVCNGVVNITAIQNCNDCGVIDFCIPNGCETSLDDPEELFYAQCFVRNSLKERIIIIFYILLTLILLVGLVAKPIFTRWQYKRLMRNQELSESSKVFS